MSASKIRLGIIGCGGWGRNWVREAFKAGVLAAVCDTRLDELDLPIDGSVKRFHSTDDLLQQSDVDGVIVVTPAEQHHEVALKVIAAGKHVFIEKPLAVNLQEAVDIEQACQQAGRVGMVGHLMLYHPAIAWIKEYIDSGQMGDLYYMTARRLNLGKIRQNENATWSFAPHDLSVALHVFEEAPNKIEATGTCFLQPSLGVEDVGFMHLNFPSGKMFHGHFSWLDPVKRREIVFVGSKKMIVFEDSLAKEKLKVHDKGAVTKEEGHAIIDDPAAPQIFSGEIITPDISSESPLTRELNAFLKAIEGDNTANLSPLSQGVEVIRILEKARS